MEPGLKPAKNGTSSLQGLLWEGFGFRGYCRTTALGFHLLLNIRFWEHSAVYHAIVRLVGLLEHTSPTGGLTNPETSRPLTALAEGLDGLFLGFGFRVQGLGFRV